MVQGLKVLYCRQIRLLERCHQCCLRTFLEIQWQDFYVSKKVATVLEKANPPITAFILLELVPLHYSKYGGLPPTKVTSLCGELQVSKQD